MNLPPGYTHRSAVAADVSAIERMLADCDALEAEPGYAGLARHVQSVLEDEAPRRRGEAIVVQDERGEMAACAAFNLPDYPRPIAFARLGGAVRPRHRRRGIGTALVRWSEDRATALWDLHRETRPRSLRISFAGAREDAERLYLRAGYVFHDRSLQLRRPLSEPIDERPLPPGITAVSWSAKTGPLFYAAYNAVHADEPEARTRTEAEWCADVAQDATLRSDLTLVALDSAADPAASTGSDHVDHLVNPNRPDRLDQLGSVRPCAYILSEVVPRDGREIGWTWRLGVHPAYRRRGIATSLLCYALAAYQREGLPEAGLWVDEANPAARATYDRLGFRYHSRHTTFAKDLHAQP